MPSLSFKERFAAEVESGRKRQSIRPRRKYPIRKGQTLYLFTGMRTRECRKLGEFMCMGTEPITITENDVIFVNCARLDAAEMLALAQADGFEDVRGFLAFFRQNYGRRFEGDIIHW